MDLLPIGRFARITGLTVRALRHYDELGLLAPTRVDGETGYRYYAAAQSETAETIRRLRALELPLDEIRLVLAEPELQNDRLIAHRARLEGRAAETRQILAQLKRLIDRKEPLVPEKKMIQFRIEIREIPEQQVVGIRERAQEGQLSTLIPRAIGEVEAYLEEVGVEPAGLPFTVCPFADEDGMADIAVAWPVTDRVEGRGRIESWTLPGGRALWFEHRGPYQHLTGSYRLLEQVIAENNLTPTSDPREVYVTDPEEVSEPADYVTEIVWPIGPEGELNENQDVFKRRIEVDART